MKERINYIIKNVSENIRAKRMKKIKYESLSFIQDD